MKNRIDTTDFESKKSVSPNTYRARRAIATFAAFAIMAGGIGAAKKTSDNHHRFISNTATEHITLSQSPEGFGSVDKDIKSIYIMADAIIRENPYRPNLEMDSDNTVMNVKEPFMIEVDEDLQLLIHDDNINQPWVGVPVEYLQNKFPDYNFKVDPKNPDSKIVWVSTQKAIPNDENGKKLIAYSIIQ